MAYVITSHLEGLSYSKGFLGLSQDSLFSVVNDINGSHVGIELNYVESVASVNAEIDLKGGKEFTAWLEYRGDLKMVNKPPGLVLEAQIDLFKQFKELVYVGFCTLNGKVSCAWIVDSWRFKVCDGSLPSMIPMDCWEEQDCFMCGDSSIYYTFVNVEKKKIEKEISFGLVGLAPVLCVLCCVYGKKRVVSARRSGRGCKVERSRVPTSLSLEEIKPAALEFDRGRIVGEETSAKVYKWCLPSGGEVVVKRFETMAGGLRHKNLVQLPLATELATMAGCLRYKNIVLGVASALANLQEECDWQTIHIDGKTCNITLDAGFNAKLEDFGLAKVYEHSAITRMGYLVTEYVYSGLPTVKKDVCSFGVVVIDVVMGRKPVEEDDGTVIVDWLWGLWEVGKLIEAADLRLTGKFDKVEMERMLMTGLACVHQNQVKRPTVEEGAGILQGEAPLPVLNARKPRGYTNETKRSRVYQAEYLMGLAKYLSIPSQEKQPYHFLKYLNSETRVLLELSRICRSRSRDV